MENTAIQTTDNGIQIAEVQKIIGEAPQVLTSNRNSSANAIQFADNLIQNSKDNGMSDELDSQMSTFIQKAKKTIETMNEKRKPFTQMMDLLKKEFTGMEGGVKVKVEEIQSIRNTYASKKMEEQREKERLAREKLEREREAIELKKKAETELSNNFNKHLLEAKQTLLEMFNGATLENISEIFLDIAEWSVLLTKETYKTFRPTISGKYHNDTEGNVFASEAMNSLFSTHQTQYSEDLGALKRELMDKKETKRGELEAIAKADNEERARLEEERKLREAAEKEKLEKEKKEADEKAAAAAAVKAAGEEAGAIIDAEVVINTDKPNVKEGYGIELTNVAANLLIAQFWFEKEGKNLPQTKIEKFTFERMRKFCEAYALKHEEFIDSPFIKYNPIYKAK